MSVMCYQNLKQKFNIFKLFLAAAVLMLGFAAIGLSGSARAVTCQNIGDGRTAVYINQSVTNETIDLSAAGCDMAIYFDEDAPRNATVRGVTVTQTSGANVDGSGILSEGGNVSVSRSKFVTDVTGQFLPLRFEGGAQASVNRNELSGTHRVGILVRGQGTDVQLNGNTITGTGAKTGGWAENGIQVDQGARVSVKNNTVAGHWWDGESNWASTGIMIFGASGANLTNNTLIDNEFSFYVAGGNNRLSGNTTSSSIVSASSLNFQAYGVLVAGANNHVAGNHITGDDGAVGIYVFGGSEGNRITGNRIGGFSLPIYDGGSDTMSRGNPSVFN